MFDYKEFDKDFDKNFKAARRMAIIYGLVSMAISILVLGFMGWVVVKLMTYFGVI